MGEPPEIPVHTPRQERALLLQVAFFGGCASIVLTVFALLPADVVTRTVVLGFVVCVWGLQLAVSRPWLERFRFGPLEWAWRSATYRRVEPLRRRDS